MRAHRDDSKNDPIATPTLQTLFERLVDGLQGVELDAGRLPPVVFPALPSAPLGSAIPKTAGPFHWRQFLRSTPVPSGARVLDFGCGAADRRGEMEGLGLRWMGIDIPTSREAKARSERKGLAYYGGGALPFKDASFALVLSTQTFEHVPDPHQTMAELARVTSGDGLLVGSTSAMEPFHSNSTFTYTPKLFADLVTQHGFVIETLAPGIDAFTLLARRLAQQFRQQNEVQALSAFFAQTSPLHSLLDELGRRQRVEPRRVNTLKLELCGVFHFRARRAS